MRAIAYIGMVFVLLFVVMLIPSHHARTSVEFNTIDMVLVPKGCITWAQPYDDNGCIEQPFWIAQHRVTRKEYNRFVQEAGRGYSIYSSDADWIDESVTWFQAHDYCAEYGMRLPSVRELEFAALGPHGADNKIGRWINLDVRTIEWGEWTDSLEDYDTSHSERYIPYERRVWKYAWQSGSYTHTGYLADNHYRFRCAMDADYQPDWKRHLYPGSPPPSPHPTDYNAE